MNTDQLECITRVEQKLDVEFNNKSLLLEAITHRSYLNEHRSHPVGHNERLEFLGDAVLEIVVTEMLYKKYPDEPEGILTERRAALVCAETLGPLYESLDLWEVLLLSKGEKHAGKEGNNARKHICANTLEAIIGAIFVDNVFSLGVPRMIIDHLLHSQMTKIIAGFQDEKSDFQEYAQRRFGITPRYKVVDETGEDHRKTFTIGVFLETIEVGRSQGISKKEAQKNAAKTARETITQWEGRIAEADRSTSAMRRSKTGVQR